MKLHWQILIALLLSIIMGLLFPTEYKLDNERIEKLAKQNISTNAINKLNTITDQVFKTEDTFLAQIDSLDIKDISHKQKSTILKIAYYNPFVNSVSWLGTLFLRLLKMIIIPLILSSLISGITNIQSGENLGKIMLKTFGYYVLTSFLAILTGLFMVNLFKPGVGMQISQLSEVNTDTFVDKQQSIQEIILGIVPENIFQAMASSQMLSIIFFAILFGYFITRVADKHKTVLKGFFNATFEVMMKITLLIIKFTPIGIFGIVVKVVADQSDLVQLVSSLGMYMATVIIALAIHFFISLPLLTKLLAKVNPFHHMKNMITPLLTAFSTSSSGATLPLTMDAVENKSGVSNKISSFTLPLGATINMDGTALYECVAAIFIAQAYGIDLSLFEQFLIVITALLASIGAAAIPMAGLVMITVILTAVGLPLEGIGLILAVDRILDMFRTATNVWSDSNAAVIIAKSEGEKLTI